jgi:hypothetical protein
VLFDCGESIETANAFEPHHYQHSLSDIEAIGTPGYVSQTPI